MAAPSRNRIPPIQLKTPPSGREKPPRSQRGIRIATVPGTTMVNRSVLKIGQNLGGIGTGGKTAETTLR
jgi:hypothetical protein